MNSVSHQSLSSKEQRDLQIVLEVADDYLRSEGFSREDTFVPGRIPELVLLNLQRLLKSTSQFADEHMTYENVIDSDHGPNHRNPEGRTRAPQCGSGQSEKGS